MSQTLTPSFKGSIFAGIGLWSLIWGVAAKSESIPILGNFINRQKIYSWVNDNKALSLLLTETTNVVIHGVTDPNATAFTLGGTLCNIIVIFMISPFVAKCK